MKNTAAVLLLCASGALAAEVRLPQLSLKSFAATPAPISGPAQPEKPMEAKAPTLDQAANSKVLLQQLGILLTEAQRKHLAEQRFVLIDVKGTRLETVFEPPSNEKDDEGRPVDYRSTPDEMLNGFDHVAEDTSDPWSRSAGQAKFITADLAMHAYHRFFSQALEFIEQRQLRARLEDVLELAMTSMRRRPHASASKSSKRNSPPRGACSVVRRPASRSRRKPILRSKSRWSSPIHPRTAALSSSASPRR